MWTTTDAGCRRALARAGKGRRAAAANRRAVAATTTDDHRPATHDTRRMTSIAAAPPVPPPAPARVEPGATTPLDAIRAFGVMLGGPVVLLGAVTGASV